MDDVLNRILSELKSQRKKQQDLTDFLGVSQNNFGNWKAGRNSSYKKYLHAIADFLNVSVEYLKGETDKPNIIKTDITSDENGEFKMLFDKLLILDDDDRQTVNGLVDTLLRKEKYNKKPDQNVG